MLAAESRIVLPPVPADQVALPVAIWAEPVVIDTYPPDQPDRFPAFLDNRVYQGSSGRVYPLPFHERISPTKSPWRWSAVHLENKWIRLMVLPELGGRIHIGYDKIRGEDFFYRNNVIKPALAGLAGPWISGGVEFNWPQHHRPGTYLPTDTSIERGSDGSVTVWCSDHEPLNRMKGMHGIRLYPDRALVEVRVRLYNRTEETQTFLWWANVAARVHEGYQSFFPPDVTHVADHAKRATTTFPRVQGSYYGVDYPARVDAEHPDADRIDWYRNIPVPTSYMCVGSEGDFFGGYNHNSGVGFVHWADHHISPGKKQWTWGNAPFGWAWDRQLTDTDGPYIELMAGVYTDNQPDFSFLTPGETKSFSQFWYPIHDIGPAQAATLEAVASLVAVGPDQYRVGVSVTGDRPGSMVTVSGGDGSEVLCREVDLAPGYPALIEFETTRCESDLVVLVRQGQLELVRLQLPTDVQADPPAPATEPPRPEEVASVEELYLTGLHLWQYRHATRSPEPYWREALRRDPSDSRSNVALAALSLRRGQYNEAEALLTRAVARLTHRNPNPADGEAHYRLGLTLQHRQRWDEAYDSFAKSAWNSAWRAPAHYSLATLDCRAARWSAALRHLDQALSAESDHLQAADLRVMVLRRLGRSAEADQQLLRTRALDPLDNWAIDLAGHESVCDAQTLLDVALEYAGSGFVDEALDVLDRADRRALTSPTGVGGVAPLIGYHRADLLRTAGRQAEAKAAAARAAEVDPGLCLPVRLEDANALVRALLADPTDSRAAALLGHWLYANGRHLEAIEHWRLAVDVDPTDPVVWRNLGLAAVNVLHDNQAATGLYHRAVELAPDDPRLNYEVDQLAARQGTPVAQRVSTLAGLGELVRQRDDLTVVLAELLIQSNEPDSALELLSDRVFQPWEGGEGQVLDVWESAHAELARRALAGGRPAAAADHLRAALAPPESLGEARHPLVNSADLHLALGDALRAAGGDPVPSWQTASNFVGDFQNMSSNAFSEMTYFSVLGCRRLEDHAKAQQLIAGLEQYIRSLTDSPAMIDYFATSLPTMLLFNQDGEARRTITVLFLSAQLAVLRGETVTAVEMLHQVLSRDPAHCAARILLTELPDLSEWSSGSNSSSGTAADPVQRRQR